jgi:hypothetical protein
MFILHLKCAWSWELRNKYITFTLHMNCAWSCEMGMNTLWSFYTQILLDCVNWGITKKKKLHSFYKWIVLDHVNWGTNTLWSSCTWIVFDHVNCGTNALWSFYTWLVLDHVNWGTNTLCSFYTWIVLDRTNWQIEEKWWNYIHSTSELCSIMRIWEIRKLCWFYKGIILDHEIFGTKKITFILYIELWSIITIGQKQIMCVVLKYELCSYHSWKIE